MVRTISNSADPIAGDDRSRKALKTKPKRKIEDEISDEEGIEGEDYITIPTLVSVPVGKSVKVETCEISRRVKTSKARPVKPAVRTAPEPKRSIKTPMFGEYDDYLANFTFIEECTSEERRELKDRLEDEVFGNVEDEVCPHTDKTVLNGAEICMNCGVVTDASISLDDKDSRYYGISENRNSKDPTRCHKRKSSQRSIHKDVEGMQFPESIVEEASKKYQEIIGNEIYRGAKRKSIIVACIYYAYLDQQEFKTLNELVSKFGLNKKSVKEGMSKYCERFKSAATKYVEPKDLIYGIMLKVGINFAHLRKIRRLCEYLDNRSALLNRSNPRSVAAAIVYLYLCLEPEYKNKLGMTKMKFANLVNLSDITITKLGKEAQMIIQNNEIKL